MPVTSIIATKGVNIAQIRGWKRKSGMAAIILEIGQPVVGADEVEVIGKLQIIQVSTLSY
ncbi:MAG TPA: hypothetical protein VGL27_15775 [Negativicutes bacterium]